MVKFISYDGTYPTLCYGTLTVKVDNNLVKLVDVLISGWDIYYDYNDGEEYADIGEWTVDLEKYPELQCYEKEITDLVNANVEHGCCGGCV